MLLGNGKVGLENVDEAINTVTARRALIAAFIWWEEKGDGCIVRVVAIVGPPGGGTCDNQQATWASVAGGPSSVFSMTDRGKEGYKKNKPMV